MTLGVLVLVSALVLLLLLQPVSGGDVGEVVFVILSQSNSFHASRAEHKAQVWREDLQLLTKKESVIILTHTLQLEEDAWTVAPIFPLLSEYVETASWFFFTTEDTQVDFVKLGNVLDIFDPQQELFLGHSLQDTQPTILHHYAPPSSLSYPSFPSGWALSSPALAKAAAHVRKFSPSFNIDPQYELAQFLKYLRTIGVTESLPRPPPPPPEGIPLTHVPQFCVSDSLFNSSCATAYVQKIPDCDAPLPLDKVFFAVKTCAKYHSTRLPVVMETWASQTAPGGIGFYSEVEDPVYSTTDIGVPNTERGHCGKCLAIIDLFYTHHKEKEWLVVADDDTLLSVPRLVKLLRCYDPSHPILLGEVYGYYAHTPGGSSYVTGGGSMVLSRRAVTSLVESGIKCPKNESPDDMFLGSVAKHLHWDVVHSPLFHQAQPDSFHPLLLKQQREPVSFHRHTPQSPLYLYHQLLASDRERRQKETYKEKTEL